MPDRARTHEILGLLTVPQAAVLKTDEAIVVWWHRLVFITRDGDGWRAFEVQPVIPSLDPDAPEPAFPNDVAQHPFTTIEEFDELLTRLWPMNDATAAAIEREETEGPDPTIVARVHWAAAMFAKGMGKGVDRG